MRKMTENQKQAFATKEDILLLRNELTSLELRLMTKINDLKAGMATHDGKPVTHEQDVELKLQQIIDLLTQNLASVNHGVQLLENIEKILAQG